MSKSSLSKEDMALEALIKLVTELEGSHTNWHVNQTTLSYAKQALSENGWEVYLDEFGRSYHRKIPHAQKD